MSVLNRRLIRSLGSGLALVIALAGCGSGAASQGAPGVPGQATHDASAGSPASAAGAACDLLTDAQIKELTGHEVEAKEAGKTLYTATNGCTWTLKSAVDNPTVVVIGVIDPGGKTMFDNLFGATGDANRVTGLGDAAIQVNDQVIFVRGDTMVALMYSTFPLDQESGRKLAEAVLARLAAAG
jgi:ABC-type glycerol-3-phosphate transport system substrate-binding protein